MSMQLKQWIWRLAPKPLHLWLRNIYFMGQLLPQLWYDATRFFKYSGLNKSRDYRQEQAARIVMTYHQLEKGLSYAVPRPGFGQAVVARLFALLEPFILRHGLVQPASTALSTLQAYMRFNKQANVDIQQVQTRVDELFGKAELAMPQADEGGVIHLSKEMLQTSIDAGFKPMFLSRHSIRHFSGEKIPLADIEEIVRIAQKTPSVCNRQSWRVHLYQDAAKIQQLLELQAGSRGFGEQASALLMITSDLSTFVDANERYQAWIDGGMFAMSVSLAIHALGYGSCCLNWSKSAQDDRALRRMTSILPHEQVIMMIAVGTLPTEFNVAASARKPLHEVLILG